MKYWSLLRLALLAMMFVLPASCALGQTRSVDGRVLVAPPMDVQKRSALERDLASARRLAAANPNDEDAAIWVGRRLGYLGRYHEAISWYSESMKHFGRTPKLLRHRGHRFITVREFAAAESDLAEGWAAVEAMPDSVEPDGIVTPAGPRSTLKGNIAYHLALARFCRGSLDSAAAAWRDAIGVATNEDSSVSARYWLAVTEFEAGRADLARSALEPVGTGMDVRENRTYLDLALALRGDLDVTTLTPKDSELGIAIDRATLGFGLAMHARHIARDEALARQRLHDTARLPEWAAFGVIASEALAVRQAVPIDR
jgi:tetratricopeptide (TPR) repeat protein